MPGLPIPSTRGQASRFDNLLYNWCGHWFVLKLANCQNSANRVKYIHNVPLYLSKIDSSMVLGYHLFHRWGYVRSSGQNQCTTSSHAIEEQEARQADRGKQAATA